MVILRKPHAMYKKTLRNLNPFFWDRDIVISVIMLVLVALLISYAFHQSSPQEQHEVERDSEMKGWIEPSSTDTIPHSYPRQEPDTVGLSFLFFYFLHRPLCLYQSFSQVLPCVRFFYVGNFFWSSFCHNFSSILTTFRTKVYNIVHNFYQI